MLLSQDKTKNTRKK